ncbi:hypothetical protein RJ639_033544 [Escallonia herrerae]|uniref:Aquaporin n=1 Tax=Escallonia herrerae TaxID=1293975 RepID=A0AA88WVD5_9ASTE|nr:hypothetical protein RJ639_033544 [Escallonia herrerae]
MITELFGTYILMFVGCGAALVDREKTLTIIGIAMVWGLALMAVIYAVGHISDAHLNPTVTIAFAAACRFPLIQSKGFSGVAIGVTLLFNVIIAGPITGASMNPARSIGPAVVSGAYRNIWVFVVSPILGAMAAAMIYSLLRPSKTQKNQESSKSIYNDLYLHSNA